MLKIPFKSQQINHQLILPKTQVIICHQMTQTMPIVIKIADLSLRKKINESMTLTLMIYMEESVQMSRFPHLILKSNRSDTLVPVQRKSNIQENKISIKRKKNQRILLAHH